MNDFAIVIFFADKRKRTSGEPLFAKCLPLRHPAGYGREGREGGGEKILGLVAHRFLFPLLFARGLVDGRGGEGGLGNYLGKGSR